MTNNGDVTHDVIGLVLGCWSDLALCTVLENNILQIGFILDYPIMLTVV